MSESLIQPELLDQLLTETDPISVPSSQVESLRKLGCDIDEIAPGQFRLQRTSLNVWSDYLAWRCPLADRSRIIEVYRATASTQDGVRRLIEATGDDADGALIIADEHTSGRGRLGRSWQAPAGTAILVSRAVVSRDANAIKPDHLAVASAVAVATALSQVVLPRKLDIRIKWPNDIVVEGRKLAGILIETLPSRGAAIIGIGVNVSLQEDQLPAELKDRATSLTMLECEIDRLAVLSHLVRALDGALRAETDPGWLVRQWRAFNVFSADRAVTFRHNGKTVRGCVMDLDATQGLIVRTESGQIIELPAASTSVVVEE
jgi:BirA family biotin operon repressor/biotin-[acetyl-CoA-carboxylase] ligase